MTCSMSCRKIAVLLYLVINTKVFKYKLLLPLQGMACVGRTKQCTIVPSNHYGPIPSIPVGSLWKFRVQVSPRNSRVQLMLLNCCNIC